MLLYLMTRPAHRADQALDEDIDEIILEADDHQIHEPDTYDVIMAEYRRLGIA